MIPLQRLVAKLARGWQLPRLRGTNGETCVMDFGQSPSGVNPFGGMMGAKGSKRGAERRGQGYRRVRGGPGMCRRKIRF